jgi:tetratricopeptide (TPR) repeat protein
VASVDESKNSVDPVRDHLGDWPYVSHYLQATLDPDLIAMHGHAVLLRALDRGRLVCFVGSGVSMSYGRLGWGQLVRALVEKEKRKKESSKGPPTNSGNLQMQAHVRRWLDELDVGNRTPGDDLQSGRFPAAFQFLESLESSGVPANDSEGASAKAHQDDNKLRKTVREYLFDDSGQGFLLLDELEGDLKKIAALDTGSPHVEIDAAGVVKLRRESQELDRRQVEKQGSATSDRGAWRRRLHLKQRNFVLSPNKPAALPGAMGSLALLGLMSSLSKLAPPESALPLKPLLRFLATALARLGGPFEELVREEPGAHDPPVGLEVDLLPSDADPLLRLVRHLGVTRFITTNYDLDLERLLYELGFRLNKPSATRRKVDGLANSRDALGDQAHDGVFEPERANAMFDFAIQGAGRELSVIHLHGRATSGDQMVVTDRDYLNLYLRRDDQAEVAEQAIGLAFGANPLLFVGSGMNEDDILRPLRQFLAERSSREDRQAVVLLPADGSKAKQVEEVIALYSRYGVHTVHFGIGSDDVNIRPDQAAIIDWTWVPNPQGQVRWLACFKQLVTKAEQVIKAFKAWVDAGGDQYAQEKTQFMRVATELDLKPYHGQQEPEPAKQALLALCKPGAKRDDWPLLRLPVRASSSGPTAQPAAEGALELAALNGLVHFAFDLILFHAKVNAAAQWLKVDSPSDFLKNRSARIGKSLSVPVPTDSDQVIAMQRVLHTQLALAKGIPGALQGLALCLELRGIEDRLLHWRLARSPTPQARPPGGPRDNIVVPVRPQLYGKEPVALDKENPDRAEVMMRHPLALRPSPWVQREASHRRQATPVPKPLLSDVPKTDRFFSDAPSQTFGALLNALQKHLYNAKAAPDKGRRIFVLFAERGTGKGHFFEALRTPRRLGEFIEWSWPKDWSKKHGKVRYCVFGYFNLSFSIEVVTVFDRITHALAQHAKRVFGDGAHARKIHEAQVTLKFNRVARLAATLRLYASKDATPRCRLLFALSSFNLLFDERGDPKNAELYRAVNALLCSEAQRSPIDFVFVCSGFPLPAPFAEIDPLRQPMICKELDGWSRDLPRLRLQHLVRDDVSEKGLHRLADITNRLRVNLLPRSDKSTTSARAQRPGKSLDGRAVQDYQSGYFHVLREARTSNTVTKYFPEVALSLAFFPGAISKHQLAANDPDFKPLFRSRSVLESLRNKILAESRDYNKAVQMIGNILDVLLRTASDCRAAPRHVFIKTDLAESFKRAGRDKKNSSDIKPSENEVLLDEDFRAIYVAMVRSRFLVTIACAAVSEGAWLNSAAASDSVQLLAAHVVNWWHRLLTHLRSLQRDDKPDQVIAFVFKHYQEQHDRHQVLPIPCDLRALLAGPALGKHLDPALLAIQHALSGRPGWALAQRVLWHLAVVGRPMEADVLARAPALRKEFTDLVKEAVQVKHAVVSAEVLDHPALRLSLIEFVLDLLVCRCLVFRLQAAQFGDGARTDEAVTKSETQDSESRPNWRYTIHRFIQRSIFRKLHAPHVEHAAVDPFGLSMWATQPDDVPRPNRQAAEEIANLLADWTGFPRDPEHVMRASEYHRALAEALQAKGAGGVSVNARSLPARMLRSSLGVVRTVYSVGAVSRYHDFAGIAEMHAPSEGFFAQHRLQVRWLIDRALELPRHKSLNTDEACKPFFAEEFVWLYNECGLFCLIEGRLDHAAALFGVALRSAATIEEGEKHGALWCRIHLNLAVTDIERGNIREARTHLTAICAVTDENPILRLLAAGYLGLVDHYSGNSAHAENVLNKVIQDLDKYGQSRSVSIFARHLAELYRLRGQEARAQAVAAVDRALASATKGGHEDVRQMAMLSRARLAIDGLLDDDALTVQLRLDEIERYGVDMGMPRLLADVAYARASHLMELGDTRHAAQLACKCLEISTAHELRLRQMTALALLGKIYQRRGRHATAHSLLARAFDLAEACDYSNVRDTVRWHHE